MIPLKTPEEIAVMRRGGRLLRSCLDRLGEMIAPGISTGDIDRAFAAMLEEAGAAASFKGYHGFPASICSSVDHVIVHGIPDDTPLQEGQIVTVDLGVLFEGFHTDSAWTYPVGEVAPEVTRLLEVTEAALYAGIERAVADDRIGDIGAAVEDAIEDSGFALVQEYAGHGIGRELHEEPWVPNYGPPGRRERLKPGMTIAIEPMVTAGDPDTLTLDDGWTVITEDGSLAAHFEHTVAITEDGPQILTAT